MDNPIFEKLLEYLEGDLGFQRNMALKYCENTEDLLLESGKDKLFDGALNIRISYGTTGNYYRCMCGTYVRDNRCGSCRKNVCTWCYNSEVNICVKCIEKIKKLDYNILTSQ